MNFKRKFGNTPILAAAAFGRFDLVYLLLEHGADHSNKNEFGMSLAKELEKKRKALRVGSSSAKWLERVEQWLEDNKK